MGETPLDKPSWRNGYWIDEKQPQTIMVVDGDKMVAKQIICLDYPDIELPSGSDFVISIKRGDFGPARKEVTEATGEERYNIELVTEGMGSFPGVMNEAGTEMTIWGWTNSVEVTKWVSPEQVDKIRQGREHKDAPWWV